MAARKLAGSGGGIVRERIGARQYDARRMRSATVIVALFAVALGLTACGSFGSEKIAVSKDDPNYGGAELFATHCAGCHTLSAAGTQGSGNRGERTQGPNLNQREESFDDALYAIQNGGFSGAIMPQNIVVGDEAKAVAKFVAKYAGEDAESSPRPGQESP
jgi:mono/diheme cytochrome c family protein